MTFEASPDGRRLIGRCQCGACNLPWIEIRVPERPGRDAVAVVTSRHNGDHHTNVVTLADLARLIVELESVAV